MAFGEDKWNTHCCHYLTPRSGLNYTNAWAFLPPPARIVRAFSATFNRIPAGYATDQAFLLKLKT